MKIFVEIEGKYVPVYDSEAVTDVGDAVAEALTDIRARIKVLGTWHDKVMIETIDINRVLEVIDDKIKEIEHESTRILR